MRIADTSCLYGAFIAEDAHHEKARHSLGDPDPIVIPTASLRTNAAGNGTAYHVFTPEDADGLRGLTVGGMWFLVDGGSPAYATACAQVELD